MTVVDGRKKREIDPTLSMMRGAVLEAREDTEMPDVARQRMENMLDFMESMNDWYGQMSRLPKPVLLKLMKMGTKIVKRAKKKK